MLAVIEGAKMMLKGRWGTVYGVLLSWLEGRILMLLHGGHQAAGKAYQQKDIGIVDGGWAD